MYRMRYLRGEVPEEDYSLKFYGLPQDWILQPVAVFQFQKRRREEQMYKKLRNCVESVREKTDFKPDIGLVLGSGLGDYADGIEVVQTVDYGEIAGFPVSTAPGHRGRFVFGYVEGTPVVIMQGRVHYYEGYPMSDVVLPTRLMGMLGAKKLILTNAAGGINKSFQPGDFMMITDHIATPVPSPLIGANIDELGTRFPDMSEVYSKRLQKAAREAAEACGITLREGVYVQFSGPNYETPAEIQAAKSWGADAVGMSTAVEAIAACHMGLEVCGISCITNPAAGISEIPLNHEEVQAAADRAAESFKKLITSMIHIIGRMA
jgi:purine-nucleoside phosphorylase